MDPWRMMRRPQPAMNTTSTSPRLFAIWRTLLVSPLRVNLAASATSRLALVTRKTASALRASSPLTKCLLTPTRLRTSFLAPRLMPSPSPAVPPTVPTSSPVLLLATFFALTASRRSTVASPTPTWLCTDRRLSQSSTSRSSTPTAEPSLKLTVFQLRRSSVASRSVSARSTLTLTAASPLLRPFVKPSSRTLRSSTPATS
mmetsp:Transcript_26659/g.45944  ORF Transcript_26659/g.45944 Transcript_26659/m.45944 type:complete len:201 (-) Transcript_26659:675-1277(-)